MHQHAGQTQTLTRPLALREDSLYLLAFRNLLSLTSPRAQLSYLYPLHLSLLTLSVLDLVGCVLFIFHSSYSAQQLCSLYILFFGVIFICLTAYQCSLFLSSYSPHILPYCLVEFKLKVCCVRSLDCLRHQDLVLLSHPRCLFLLSVPACSVCLSTLALMDLSVVGLQHILQLWMSPAMICISLEHWDESVRDVKGFFIMLIIFDSLFLCACQLTHDTYMTKYPLISRINKSRSFQHLFFYQFFFLFWLLECQWVFFLISYFLTYFFFTFTIFLS